MYSIDEKKCLIISSFVRSIHAHASESLFLLISEPHSSEPSIIRTTKLMISVAEQYNYNMQALLHENLNLQYCFNFSSALCAEGLLAIPYSWKQKLFPRCRPNSQNTKS